MVSISAPIYSSSPGSRWQVVDLDFWSIFQVGTVLFCLSLVLEVVVFGILVLDYSLAGFLALEVLDSWDFGVGFRCWFPWGSVVLTVVVAVEVLDLASLWCLMWCFCCSGDGLVVVVSLFLEKHLRGSVSDFDFWLLVVGD
jgi:hypothetical protein